MNRLPHATDANHVIDMWKVMFFVVFIQLLSLFVIYSFDKITIAVFFAVMFLPALLLFLPVEPILGFLFMIVATGLDFMAVIGEAKGGTLHVKFTYFHVALFVTIIGVVMNMILKRSTTFPSIDLWPPMLMFLTLVGFSLIYTPDFMVGSWTFVRLVALAFVTWMIIQVVDKQWKLDFLLWVFILAPVCISILSVYQLFTRGSFYSEVVYRAASALGLYVYRATGTFTNPNKLAIYLQVGTIISFGLLFDRRYKILGKTLLTSAFLITLAGIIATFSRTGWVSTFVALSMIMVLNKKWSYFVVAAIVAFAGFIYVAISYPDIVEAVLYRFASIFSPSSDDSSSARISLIRSGIWMWQDHPIFGVGIEGFAPMMKYYFDPKMPVQTLDVIEPHTIQFEILAELGLVGVIISSWLFFTVLFKGLKTTFSMVTPELKSAQIAITSLFIGLFVSYTFATDFLDNNLWITVGLIYAIPFIEQYTSTHNVSIAADGRYGEPISSG